VFRIDAESGRHVRVTMRGNSCWGEGSDGTGGGIATAGDFGCSGALVASLEGEHKPMEGTSVHGWQRQVNATDSSVEKDLRLAG
jgi:hypothetical protein